MQPISRAWRRQGPPPQVAGGVVGQVSKALPRQLLDNVEAEGYVPNRLIDMRFPQPLRPVGSRKSSLAVPQDLSRLCRRSDRPADRLAQAPRARDQLGVGL